MTTFESNPSFSQFFAWKLGKAISKRNERSKLATNALSWMQATIRIVLQLSGFGFLTYAGFQWSTIAGLVIAGMSCFVLSWLLTTTASPSQRPNQTDTRMR